MNMMNAGVSVTIASPSKVGEGVKAFYVYPITSVFRKSANDSLSHVKVHRRYSDFVWLHAQV